MIPLISDRRAAAAPGPFSRASRSVLAWLALLLVTLALWALPAAIEFPEPATGIALHEAEFQPGAAAPARVALPFLWERSAAPGADSATLTLSFRPPAEDAPLALFIPALRQPVSLTLNGTPLQAIGTSRWSGTRSGYFLYAPLPAEVLVDSPNQLELRMTRAAPWLSGYLSAVHILHQAELNQILLLPELLIEQGQATSLALHILLAISVFVILVLRRHDPVFRWLSLTAVASLAVVLLELPLLTPMTGDARSLVLLFQTITSLLLLRLALELHAIRIPPRLGKLMLALPVGLAVLLLPGLPFAPGALASACLSILCFSLSTLVTGDLFARRGEWMGAALAPACGLTVLCALHDLLLALGLSEGHFMLTPYARFVILASVMALLMGHLVQSLNRGDASQALLQERLAEQEQELQRLHREERERLGQQILAQERERLMRDLHDGISGHLISILAQAEKQGQPGEAIRQSAGDALFDLRLVVQSLDLGEDDLRLALAGLRERLQPQLRRVGVTLTWSMEHLPDVSGMTSGIALAILRILQEAITNALKHGPASTIDLIGRAGPAGAEILVRSDIRAAHPDAPGEGDGLSNMRRRAATFGGSVDLALSQDRAELTLALPLRLSETTV